MFVSTVSGLFLKLIYHGAGMVVHLLLLKFSMVQTDDSDGPNKKLTSSLSWAMVSKAFVGTKVRALSLKSSLTRFISSRNANCSTEFEKYEVKIFTCLSFKSRLQIHTAIAQWIRPCLPLCDPGFEFHLFVFLKRIDFKVISPSLDDEFSFKSRTNLLRLFELK